MAIDIAELDIPVRLKLLEQAKKDLRDLGRQGSTVARDIERSFTTASTVTSTLNNNAAITTRTMTRATFAVQGLALSMDSGRISANALANTLASMGGRLGAVGLALSLGASAYNLFSARAKEAAKEHEDAEKRITESIRRIRNAGRTDDQQVALLRARAQAARAELDSIRDIALPYGSAGLQRAGTAQAVATNADNERRRGILRDIIDLLGRETAALSRNLAIERRRESLAAGQVAYIRAIVDLEEKGARIKARDTELGTSKGKAGFGTVQDLQAQLFQITRGADAWQLYQVKLSGATEETVGMVRALQAQRAALDSQQQGMRAYMRSLEDLSEKMRRVKEADTASGIGKTKTDHSAAGGFGSFIGGGGSLGGLLSLASAIPALSVAASVAGPLIESLADALFGVNEQAEALRRFNDAMDDMRFNLSGPSSLDRELRRITDEFNALREAAMAARGGDPRFVQYDLNQRMAEIDELERQAREQARAAEAAQKMADAMERATDRIEALERTISDLQRFRGGLSLNPQLTILSPMQQLAEARRQYEEVLTAAQGGDQNAAGRLGGAAQAFLTASRSVNASGRGYVADFLRVQSETGAVEDMFRDQLSVQEQMLEELRKIAQNTTPPGTPGGPGFPHNPVDPNLPGGPIIPPFNPHPFDPNGPNGPIIIVRNNPGFEAAMLDELRRLRQAVTSLPNPN